MARYRRARSSLKTRLAKARKLPKAPHQLCFERRLNFFDFPGELRNKIYRLHLAVDRIIVKKNQFTEPPLLSACRRIRKEAAPIFYLENKWTIDCPDWEYELKLAFRKHVRSRPGIHSLASLQMYWHNSGSYTNRAGLLEHIKMARSSSILGRLQYQPEMDAKTAAVTGAFEIAYREWMQQRHDRDAGTYTDICAHIRHAPAIMDRG